MDLLETEYEDTPMAEKEAGFGLGTPTIGMTPCIDYALGSAYSQGETNMTPGTGMQTGNIQFSPVPHLGGFESPRFQSPSPYYAGQSPQYAAARIGSAQYASPIY